MNCVVLEWTLCSYVTVELVCGRRTLRKPQKKRIEEQTGPSSHEDKLKLNSINRRVIIYNRHLDGSVHALGKMQAKLWINTDYLPDFTVL